MASAPPAVTTFLIIKALHVIAAFCAYGLPLAYPMLLPYVRRNHPRAMPGVHDVQHRLNVRLTGPGTVLLFAFGVYLAGDQHLWGQTYVIVGLVILAIIVVAGGLIVQMTARMAELATAAVAATPAGGEIAFGADYERVYRRYMAIEVGLGLLVLVAIFFMVAKPFS
jgi:uncharacterized membrane protein